MEGRLCRTILVRDSRNFRASVKKIELRGSSPRHKARTVAANIAGSTPRKLLKIQTLRGFVRVTPGRVRMPQHAQTRAAVRLRGRATRPTRRLVFRRSSIPFRTLLDSVAFTICTWREALFQHPARCRLQSCRWTDQTRLSRLQVARLAPTTFLTSMASSAKTSTAEGAAPNRPTTHEKYVVHGRTPVEKPDV
jgi:hypothetical protein